MLHYDAIIIGGGFFGCTLALHLHRKYKLKVVILERDRDLLQRASFANQARVHNGYHYPRSILTALRSRVNFPRFVSDYTDCVADSFDAYYAVVVTVSLTARIDDAQCRCVADVPAVSENASRDLLI